MKLEEGQELVAINPCKMRGSNEEVLTVGKSYSIKGVDKHSLTIENDQGFAHRFSMENLNTNFRVSAQTVRGKKDDQGKVPLGIVCQRQFPNALSMIAEGSQAGHEKYKDSDPDWLNFKRVDNGKERYLNALYRHLAEAGKDLDGVDEGTKIEHIKLAGWNMLALLETLNEEK